MQKHEKKYSEMSNISETLFIPIWARAEETERQDSLVQDTYAVRILGAFDGIREKYRGSWLSQLSIAVRTRSLDRVVSRFLAAHPRGTVITLGCGFDARSRRLDNGLACWVDVDLPEVMEQRRKYFADSQRHISIAGSALDPAWTAAVPDREEPVLAILEGLLMYFSPDKVRGILDILGAAFPGLECCFDVIAARYVGRAHKHDTVSKCAAPFLWGAECFEDVLAVRPGLTLLRQRDFFDCPAHRMRWLRFFRWVRSFKTACQIFHVRFDGLRTSLAG